MVPRCSKAVCALQAQLDEALAAQAEQQQAEADMQASNAWQHAQEVGDLHRQLQAAQAGAAAAEARSAAAAQVHSLPPAGCSRAWGLGLRVEGLGLRVKLDLARGGRCKASDS